MKQSCMITKAKKEEKKRKRNPQEHHELELMRSEQTSTKEK